MPSNHDFSALNVARQWAALARGVMECYLDTDENNIGSADKVLMFTNPGKPLIVERVEMLVLTAEGGTLTVDVGDYDVAALTNAVDADGWLDGVDGNATAKSLLTSLTLSGGAYVSEYARGKYYPAGEMFIAALFNNAADAAKLLFRLHYSEVCVPA